MTAGSVRANLVGAIVPASFLELAVPADSSLLSLPAEEAALVELTDVAPVAMRNRIRARLMLAGWLVPMDGAVRFTPGVARLTTGGQESTMDAEALLAAAPDPLADREAGLLCHLAEAHPEAIETLCRFIPTHMLQGVRRVLPLAVDRHGVVLRLESRSHDRDARIPFRTPVHRAEDVPDRMLDLLAHAPRCVRDRRR